jgi:hypothetical protein
METAQIIVPPAAKRMKTEVSMQRIGIFDPRIQSFRKDSARGHSSGTIC